MEDGIDQNMRKCKNYLALLGEFVSTLQKRNFSVKRGPAGASLRHKSHLSNAEPAAQ